MVTLQGNNMYVKFFNSFCSRLDFIQKIEIILFLFLSASGLIYSVCFDKTYKYFNKELSGIPSSEMVISMIVTIIYILSIWIILIYPFASIVKIIIMFKCKLYTKRRIFVLLVLAVLYLILVTSTFALYMIDTIAT